MPLLKTMFLAFYKEFNENFITEIIYEPFEIFKYTFSLNWDIKLQYDNHQKCKLITCF